MTINFLGKRLKQAFKENHLTQEDVAKQLNVTRQQVSNWCRSVCTPPFLMLLEIMELTHKDANYFFGFPSNNNSAPHENTAHLRKGIALIYQALQEFENNIKGE